MSARCRDSALCRSASRGDVGSRWTSAAWGASGRDIVLKLYSLPYSERCNRPFQLTKHAPAPGLGGHGSLFAGTASSSFVAWSSRLVQQSLQADELRFEA